MITFSKISGYVVNLNSFPRLLFILDSWYKENDPQINSKLQACLNSISVPLKKVMVERYFEEISTYLVRYCFPGSENPCSKLLQKLSDSIGHKKFAQCLIGEINKHVDENGPDRYSQKSIILKYNQTIKKYQVFWHLGISTCTD